MTRYQTFFKYISTYDLITQLNCQNSFQLPILDSISLNLSSSTVDKKQLLTLFLILELLSGQQGQLTFSKKNKIQFKIKKGMLVGCKVTLNSTHSYTFLETLNTFLFPNLKHFYGITGHQSTTTLSFQLTHLFHFPEFQKEFSLVNPRWPLHITIRSRWKTDYERDLLLTSLNFPLQRIKLRK